jgi:hypothetical protein
LSISAYSAATGSATGSTSTSSETPAALEPLSSPFGSDFSSCGLLDLKRQPAEVQFLKTQVLGCLIDVQSHCSSVLVNIQHNTLFNFTRVRARALLVSAGLVLFERIA